MRRLPVGVLAVAVGVREGLRHPSAVNLDHVQSAETARLTCSVESLGPATAREACRVLAIAVG